MCQQNNHFELIKDHLKFQNCFFSVLATSSRLSLELKLTTGINRDLHYAINNFIHCCELQRRKINLLQIFSKFYFSKFLKLEIRKCLTHDDCLDSTDMKIAHLDIMS